MSGIVSTADVYSDAVRVARTNKQVIGEKSDYYLTIQQLEAILQARQPEDGPVSENALQLAYAAVNYDPEAVVAIDECQLQRKINCKGNKSSKLGANHGQQ